MQRRCGECEQEPAGEGDRDERAAQDAIEDRAPDAAVALRAAVLVQEWHVQPVDVVAERGEGGGQDGERADYRDRDHDHRRESEAHECLVAGEQHAGHCDHHGQAGDEHGAAGGRGGGLERGPFAASGGPLLAFALEVEERVVDADRQPDQEHDHADVLVERDQLARQRQQSHRREHRRQCEQQRQACGDQGAEGNDQHDQRDRQREQPGLLEIAHDRVVQLRLDVDAELLDRDSRVPRGGGDDRLLHGLVELRCLLRVGGAKLQRRECRVAIVGDPLLVAGGERRLDLLHLRHAADRPYDIGDRGPEGRIVDRHRGALDQDLVALSLLEHVAEQRVDVARLAGAGLVRVELLGADGVSDHERDGDERQPAEDRCLLVACTPATHAGRKVVRALQG